MTRLKNWFKRFHRDEKGLEALQVVLIVAIAAIILALLKAFWPWISNFFRKNVLNIIGGEGGQGGDNQGGWQ